MWQNIPYKFSKSYFKEQHGRVILSVPDGRTWIVEYKFDVFTGNTKAKFLCFWIPFASENKLGSTLSLAVTVLRVADDDASFLLIIIMRSPLKKYPNFTININI